MMKRLSALLCAALLVFPAVPPPALADVSARQALQAIAGAGYSGVGGVTRSGRYFIASGLSPRGRRVRVSVDAGSGAVASVAPFPRGAGSVTPQAARPADVEPPAIAARPMPQLHPPGPATATEPIGVTNYPFTAGSQPAPAWCRFRANAPGC